MKGEKAVRKILGFLKKAFWNGLISLVVLLTGALVAWLLWLAVVNWVTYARDVGDVLVVTLKLLAVTMISLALAAFVFSRASRGVERLKKSAILWSWAQRALPGIVKFGAFTLWLVLFLLGLQLLGIPFQ